MLWKNLRMIHFCQHNETMKELDLVASINDLVNSRQLIFLEMCIAIYTSFWYTTSQKSSFDFRDQCFSNCNLHGRHLFFPEIIDRICYPQLPTQQSCIIFILGTLCNGLHSLKQSNNYKLFFAKKEYFYTNFERYENIKGQRLAQGSNLMK